jgi:Anthrone oxygenase
MFHLLQVVTVILVAVAMALSLAHALELPGKMRLDKKAYYAVQPIYYPGFTIGGGVGDFGGTLVTIILLFLTPWGSADFWLTLVALLGLIGMHAVYWLFTHPVNQFWLEGEKLDKFSSGFFSFGTKRSKLEKETPPDWTELRNRWEYSHVARAGLALVSLIALVIAISGDG